MTQFGVLLRFYRRQCRDPLRGGMLTQERLGELLGTALGHNGYSGAAVSDWERNKSKIDEDDRPVLVGLISVLVAGKGLRTVSQANELLHVGNYRALDSTERAAIFPEVAAEAPSSAHIAAGEIPAIDAPIPTRERQKLLILLDKVQRFWVDGVLQQSLAGSPRLEIMWERVHDEVERPWEAIIDPALYGDTNREAVAGEFYNADRALLILGEAGAGKTTTLLYLAAALAARAAADQTAPVPVVLNLSSWASDRLPLADWVTAELTAKYQIPRRIGRPWLEDDALALLLDGFDEVPAAQQAGCARAINQFRQEWGLTGIVVCTRPAEYERAGVRLRLGGAIRLQPLTDAQRDHYLVAGGAHLAGLRLAIDHNDTLHELARSPLFLDVMSVVFHDAPQAEVAGLTAGAEGLGPEMQPAIQAARERLFTAYEQRMFQLHGPQAVYSPQETGCWLAWLAARMEEHDQAVFLLEEIQPSWLPDRNRRLYLLIGHAVIGLYGGLTMWLLLRLLREIIPQFPAVLAPVLAGRLEISLGYAEPLVLAAGSLALALVVAVIHLWQFERIVVDSAPAGARLRRWRPVVVGLVTGLLTTAVVAVSGAFTLAVSWGLATGFMYFMVSRYLTGIGYRREIRPVEALGWSWPKAAKGLAVGLALATAAEILETLLFGNNGVTRSLLTFGVAGLLLGGLRGRRIEEKSALNQGVRLSLRNAVIGALMVGLAMGVLTWLLRTPAAAGLSAALVALIFFPFFGGVTVPKHYLVRLFLWREGRMPWRYGRFLEHAAQFGLLRQVGGGYTFMHRLLQKHFAGQDGGEGQ